jgi:hypothetical protein
MRGHIRKMHTVSRTEARRTVQMGVALALLSGVIATTAAAAPLVRSGTDTQGPHTQGSRLWGRTANGGWYHRTPTHQHPIIPAAGAALVYGGGPVMLTTVTYAIFWEPAKLQSGTASPVPAAFNPLMAQFFRDVGGHGLYTDLTQYYEVAGGVKQYVQNSSTFGGSVVDTDPYPKAGSQCSTEKNCVDQAQLQAEIQHEMSLHSWTAGPTHTFFIFTEPSEDSCDSSGCAYSPTTGYCATHYNAPVGAVQLIYSVLPYVIPAYCGNYQGSSNTLLPSPNNNQAIDGQIDNTVHELMESATDPVNGTGWTDNTGSEIGDKCASSYTPLSWDSGHANQMANGHFYMEQDMFDNHTLTCVQLGP